MSRPAKVWAALPPLYLSLLSPLAAQQVLDPIVVTATRQESKASEVLSDVTVIDRAEIERSAGQTITDLLARQPGIQMGRNGGALTATSLFVRGANSTQTKVLVDGMPINSLDGGGSPLRYLPLADVERIEILRGPASTLYGADAVGGVIQIFTRKGEPGVKVDGFVGYGSHNTFQANAGVSVGQEKWRLRVEGNRMSSDSISARRPAGGYDADRDAYENTGGAVSLAVLPAQGHELGFSYRQNEGRTRFDGGFGKMDGALDDYVDFRASQWQLYSRNRLASFWHSTLRYGQAVDKQVSHGESCGFTSCAGVRDVSWLKTENREVSWQNDIDLPLGRLLLGAERLEQQAWPRGSFTGDDNMSNTAALAGWTANWGGHSWQANVRRDRHSAFGSENTWSLAYGYQITPQWRVRASYGTSFRAPTLVDLYRPGWGGNPDLKPEKGRNREIGLVWDSENGAHTASATYYRNDVRNLITYMYNFATNSGQLENVENARLEGVTLTYAGQLGDWGLRASYDWLNATNKSTGHSLGRRARHSGTAEVTYRWGPLETGVSWQGVGHRYDSNDQKGNLGGFSLIGLTARYAVNKNLSIEGRVDNIFDKRYELAKGYGTMGASAFVGIRYTP